EIMASCGRCGTWVAVVAVIALAQAGCGNKQAETPTAPGGQASEVILQVPNNNAAAPAAGEAKLDPRLHQSFAEATLAQPPEGAQRPPDMTLTGKPTGKLYA